MKKAIQTLCSIALLLASFGCGQRVAFDPQSVEGMKIVLTQESISFDGKNIVFPLTMDALIAELGERDGTHALHNTIRVWNNLGIYSYSRPGTSEVHQVSFAFQFEDFNFCPSNSFTGVVSIGSIYIHENSSLANLQALGFESDPITFLPDRYILEIGEISIYIDMPNNKITSASIALPEADPAPNDIQVHD